MPITVKMNQLIWDSTAFDNNYTDIMPLVESIRENGLDNTERTILLCPVGERYLVVVGRNLTRAMAMLGYDEVTAQVKPMSDYDRQRMRAKETTWKPGFREGRNYHSERPGY